MGVGETVGVSETGPRLVSDLDVQPLKVITAKNRINISFLIKQSSFVGDFGI